MQLKKIWFARSKRENQRQIVQSCIDTKKNENIMATLSNKFWIEKKRSNNKWLTNKPTASEKTQCNAYLFAGCTRHSSQLFTQTPIHAHSWCIFGIHGFVFFLSLPNFLQFSLSLSLAPCVCASPFVWHFSACFYLTLFLCINKLK